MTHDTGVSPRDRLNPNLRGDAIETISALAGVATGTGTDQRVRIAIGDQSAAFATLMRGSAFLAASLGRNDCLRAIAASQGQARVIGNGLRELDRFLNLLIDAVAAQVRTIDFDQAAFERQRNVSRKLRDLAPFAELDDIDRARLVSIGHLRACFFHCGGLAYTPETLRHAACAFGIPRGVRTKKGANGPVALRFTRADLVAIGAFYQTTALALVNVARCLGEH